MRRNWMRPRWQSLPQDPPDSPPFSQPVLSVLLPDSCRQFSRFCAPEPLFPTIVTFRSVDGIGESFQPFIPPNAELSPNIAPTRDAKCSTRLSNITITPG
ncbi:hypothetical protein TNIN_275511 [Trichonephila inaurata madagascariensis]|uniref:Uncharacterized protein n=1 Tax=Trichonephila inaurata madagascariensis TaxID=2747483 RepID=A0A8X6I716_9ARAC|nr:hypothetical protein TNIN_275511 [Trichonephila inaurata madagascariensis]